MQGVLGSKLRKARIDLGLSQAAFARALGFSSEFISLLEADKRAPSLATLNKIAAYLKKDLRDFLQEKEGAFNILLRGDALKGPGSESLDPASLAVLQRRILWLLRPPTSRSPLHQHLPRAPGRRRTPPPRSRR